MLRRPHAPPSRKQPPQPAFLVDDDSQSSQAYCHKCCQYEQDIGILQCKLMETHNKLIEQIDVCRDQELRLIKMSELHVGRLGDENASQHSNQGQRSHSKATKQQDEEYLHGVQPLIEAKTQLLRNDLEVMRTKVLSEIVKSNKLKEQNREILMGHEQELQQFRDKIRRLQAYRNKLSDDNQRLINQVQQLKKHLKANTKCNCGFQQKYYELDKAFMNQRSVTNQLIQENSKLQNKIQQLYEDQAQAQYAYKQQIRTQPKKKKSVIRQKYREQFQATKSMIRKMQQAQQQMRNRHNGKN